MEKRELHRRIDELLSQQHVITLSTNDELGPWAAPVFFAHDGFDLFFVTNPNSRHGKAIAAGSEVAGAVHASSSDWQQIKGLQMTGTAELLDDKQDLDTARKHYFSRYPFTEVFFRQQELLEPEIREKAAAVRFYRFKPGKIVLVDNSVRFGFHGELILD
jgi:uncharacterized protein YhbP (UPF0306 family)